MTIPPETKDWTWVLDEECPECGYFTGTPDRAELPGMVTLVADRWVALLPTRADVTERPAPLVWSPLEYACHVRDVFALGTYRTGLMVHQDEPTFANWDQDATAVEDDYGSQDPVLVTTQLADAAAELAEFVGSLPDAAWTRAGRRSDGAGFTVESFVRYVLHDPIHHLTDVTGQRWS